MTTNGGAVLGVSGGQQRRVALLTRRRMKLSAIGNAAL